MYKFDPTRSDLVAEYFKNPYGFHSPDLQYLLTHFRAHSSEPYHALFTEQVGVKWSLILLTPGGLKPPEHLNVEFTCLEDAERYVFRQRWNARCSDCPEYKI